MKILVVSDTHRRNDNYFTILEMHHPDMVIHCGDSVGSEYAITSGAQCPVQMVAGNNDYFSELPRELEFSIGKYRVWVTHGHSYYVTMGSEMIKREAVARGKDIVIYGHTHRPVIDIDDEVIAINPGSLSYPRQDNHRPSYIIMEMDRFEELHFTISYL